MPDVLHQSRLMTITEAAEFLNVPMSWLRDKVTQRAVPHTRLGKHVRFTREHLDQIVAQGEAVADPRVDGPLRPSSRRRRRRPTL